VGEAAGELAALCRMDPCTFFGRGPADGCCGCDAMALIGPDADCRAAMCGEVAAKALGLAAAMGARESLEAFERAAGRP
jgi:hypothetical protein